MFTFLLHPCPAHGHGCGLPWFPVRTGGRIPGANLPDGLYAVLNITTGTVIVELLPDSAPLAVMSFVGLAEGTIPADGKLYFDNLKFHRVVPGFVIQTGDPTGTGRGGPGYQFRNEIDPDSVSTLSACLEWPMPARIPMAASSS
jgi:cyclophilin family peptidyl-prolyl cis-trans isomerase